MLQHTWVDECRKNVLCIDSYENGVLAGRIYPPLFEGERFDSLTQLLLKLDQFLDAARAPQSYTTPRTFSSTLPEYREDAGSFCSRGKRATFEIQILFRQHTSWQGLIHWRERNLTQSFRSVLEMVMLMDSALRAPGDAAPDRKKVS